MKTQILSLFVLALSALLLTSCEKDSMTKLIDAEYAQPADTNSPKTEPGNVSDLSSLTIDLEATLSVKKYACPIVDRKKSVRAGEDRPIDCPDRYVAYGIAYGSSEEFGQVKAEVTIEYDASSDEITGTIRHQLESTDEVLNIEFRGLLSNSENAGMSRFHALSSHSFLDKYFTGFVSIQNLDELLKSKGLKNVPVIVSGVFE